MERFQESYAARRCKSIARADGNFDISKQDLEDELDDMVTLASSSLRLHNECSAEIHRLTKVI